jgi:predicted dehydrogenase
MVDLALWGMKAKAPDNAMAGGGKFGFPDDARETPDTMQALWNFKDHSLLWEHATFIGHGPEGREHGVAFHGNDGILVIEKGNWEVIPETQSSGADQRKAFFRSQGQPKRYTRGEDAHLEHAKNFLACMRSRELPASDVEIGHYTALACHLGNIAFRQGRSVKWDIENERVIGDAEAQKLVAKEYRAPWKLPEVV